MARNVIRRIERLETRAKEVAAVRPVHRIIFADDPVPTNLPPGSSVHRIIFVDPPASAAEVIPTVIT